MILTLAHGQKSGRSEELVGATTQLKSHRRAALPALLLLSQCIWAQNAIRLKNRTFYPSPGEAAQTSAVGAPAAPRHGHYIVQFNSFPGPEIRRELSLAGVRVLGYIPDTALLVSSDSAADLRALGATWISPLEPSDKLSPRLAQSPPAYLAIFHPDVTARQARALISQRGFAVVENPGLLPGHFAIAGSPARLAELAALDEVAYIMPASAGLAAGAAPPGCAGALTNAGAVGEYATVGGGWAEDSSGAVTLRYVFESLTSKLDPAAAKGEIERAFREWTGYANISFAAGANPDANRTVAVLFAAGAHGDGYPFYNPSILAHTFYPSPPNTEPIAGDMHFNADETWRIGADMDVFSVALHEAGHALGMGHSDDPSSVMYPYYHLVTGLTADDIAGVRRLYGAASSTPTPPSQPPSPPPAPPVPPPSNPTGATDQAAPTLRILSPGSTIVSTASSSIVISGSAGDNVGVTAVTWSASSGNSGQAVGLAAWSARIPLLVGTNVITVRAWDAAGNSGWRAITVVRF
jgi:hypothetical protein